MNQSPLQSALDWWEARDDMGGFQAAAAELFPGWLPKRACRAPHREDRAPSFSLYRGQNGRWRFKDHATGEQGGLVGFVMLAGRDERTAARWLMKAMNDKIPITNDQCKTPRRTLPARDPQPSAHWSLDISSRKAGSFAPYRLTDTELLRCHAMAEALAQNPSAIGRIAAARHWNPATMRGLALERCLGLHEGRMVLIYPTGAKLRHKPLAQRTGIVGEGVTFPMGAAGEMSAKKGHGNGDGEGNTFPYNPKAAAPRFTWMFGKPDAPWRGDRISEATACIHITEGETDAITLIDAGFDNGTTELVVAVPGASGWRDEWKEQFRGVRVVLWPDNDDAGERLTARITDSLAHVAASIGVAKFPKNPELLHLNPAT